MLKFPIKSFLTTKFDLTRLARHVLYTKTLLTQTFADSADEVDNRLGVEERPRPTPPQQFQMDDKDVIENFVKGSGPGGQSVNTSSNCVQLKHVPTGITVRCHKSRSLLENRKLARQMLFEKLDHLYRGEDSKIGKDIKKRKKRTTEQKRRQRLKEIAKSEQFILQNDILPDD